VGWSWTVIICYEQIILLVHHIELLNATVTVEVCDMRCVIQYVYMDSSNLIIDLNLNKVFTWVAFRIFLSFSV